MQLTTDQLIKGIDHPNVHVRDSVLHHLTDSFNSTLDLTRAVIAAVERNGWSKALLWPHRIGNCGLDEDSLRWCLDQIDRTDDLAPNDNTKSRLVRWALTAPVDCLSRQLHRMSEMESFNERKLLSKVTALESIEEKIEIWQLGAQRCWERLEQHCRAIRKDSNFQDANINLATSLIEPIALERVRFGDDVLRWLKHENIEEGDWKQWMLGMMILLAGRMRLEASVPDLLKHYQPDWDWYNEEIGWSISRIGTPVAHRTIAEYYPGKSWNVRNYLTGPLETIRHEGGIHLLLPLLEIEDNAPFRCGIGTAIALQFDERAIDPALAIYHEAPDDPERLRIIKTLFAFVSIAELDVPQKDEWEKLIENDWERFSRIRSSSSEQLFALTELVQKKLVRKQDVERVPEKHRRIDSYSEPKFNRLVSNRRVGRNDPCPCGSGKKYKKCCIKSEATSQFD